jgi:hypothetical protein
MSDSTTEARALLLQIADERGRAAKYRRLGSFAVLIMFGLFATVVYNQITSFDTSTLITELQRSASKTVWPLVYKELDQVGKEAVPALSKAMAYEVEQLGPKLTSRLSTEAETFQGNMGKRMKTSLDAQLSLAFEANKAKLKGHLQPFATDSELYDDLVRRLRKSGQDWAQAKLDSTFTSHIHLLQSINETVQALGKQAQAKKGGIDSANMDDVLLLMAEILNARVNEEG